MRDYKPKPIDIAGVVLPDDLYDLQEKIAENVHEIWASKRIEEGWIYGSERDEVKKETPCLVPYEQLPDLEKEYDRNTAISTLKLIIKLGYRIHK